MWRKCLRTTHKAVITPIEQLRAMPLEPLGLKGAVFFQSPDGKKRDYEELWIDEEGLLIVDGDDSIRIVSEEIEDWCFSVDLVQFDLFPNAAGKGSVKGCVWLEAEKSEIERLRLHWFCFLERRRSFCDENTEFKDCRYCGAWHACQLAEDKIALCPHCYHMTGSLGHSLHAKDGYHFDFTSGGYFDLIAGVNEVRVFSGSYRPPESFRDRMRPLWSKLWNYTLWVCVVLAFMGGVWLGSTTHYLESSLWNGVIFFSMLALFVLFSLLGYYWSALMLASAWKPLLLPSRWELLNRLIRLGAHAEVERELCDLGLESHPGFLFNWARAYFEQGNMEKGREYLERASSLCPEHPMLLELKRYYAETRATGF